MANIIKVKRSAVPGKTPITTDLELGELAINTFDGKLFIKKNDGTDSIVELGTGSGGGGASVTISDTAPSAPTENQLWWDSSIGDLRIYYNDGNSSQWVDAFTNVAAAADYTVTTSDVTTALGFTPYNATNPSGYITSSALTSYAPLSGASFTSAISVAGTVESTTGGFKFPDGSTQLTAASVGVTSISGGTTGLTPNTATGGVVTLAGTLALASGGTGQTTKAAAFNALSPILVEGDLIVGNSSGSSVRLPRPGISGRVLTSFAGTVAWRPLSVAASDISGVVSPSQGGTGIGSTPTQAGQLFISNQYGQYQLARLTAGDGIIITNGDGAITIAAGTAPAVPYMVQFRVTDYGSFGTFNSTYQQAPAVYYDSMTGMAQVWGLRPFDTASPNNYYSASEISIEKSTGGFQYFTSGSDFSISQISIAGWIFVTTFTAYNQDLKDYLTATAALYPTNSLAPGSTSTMSSTNGKIELITPNAFYSSSNRAAAIYQPDPIGSPSTFSIYMQSGTSTYDAISAIYNMYIYNRQGMMINSYSAGADYDLNYGSNETSSGLLVNVNIYNAALLEYFQASRYLPTV